MQGDGKWARPGSYTWQEVTLTPVQIVMIARVCAEHTRKNGKIQLKQTKSSSGGTHLYVYVLNTTGKIKKVFHAGASQGSKLIELARLP